MEKTRQRLQELEAGLHSAWQKLHADELSSELSTLQEQMSAPDFWQDNQKAQELTRQESKLRAVLAPWEKLRSDVRDMQEFIELGDNSMESELEGQLVDIEQRYADLKKQLLFDGPYDNHDAIVRLSAGAGGTDAQDWTEILLRMYTRWAEKSGMKVELIEQSSGEEAGLKSAVMSVSGPYAYGKLRSEHGVHRLVRLSPFNADNLRQTSFALVEVLPQIDAPDEVVIDDKDLKVDVFRAGGHGGQSVNTTDSAVRITHLPTNIVVAIQNERSQLQNKETAMKILRSKLAQLQLQQHAETTAELRAGESANWGAQIRNYVLHPYTLVKDTRTKHEEHDAQAVLDGKVDPFMHAYLERAEQ